MKNKTWIIIVTALVLIIVLASVLYPKLSEKYSPDNSADNTGSSVAVKTDDFTIYDSNLNKVKLSDYFGKPIVVNFWASWCNPCKSELPYFDEAYKKYKNNVTFLMINLPDEYFNATDNIENFISENGYSFPVYYDFDNEASRTYGVNSIPETLFIKADGTLFETRIGAMSNDVLENYIKQMIGE